MLRDLADRADAAGFASLYAAVSVETAEVRERLSRRRMTWLDPAAQRVPSLVELDHTADLLIVESATQLGTLGGIAGLGGIATLPPETVAFVVATLRLAQRLAVVYGFELESDRGRTALTRAVAAAWEVEIPEAGVSGLKVSDLARLLIPGADLGMDEVRSIGATVARGVLLGAVRLMTGRVGRLIPVVASGVSLVDNARRARELGEEMKQIYRRLVELPASAEQIRDAVEI